MRELTQVEYEYLFGDLHREPERFEHFLKERNQAVSEARRIDFTTGYRGLLRYTQVYREALPGYLQDELDCYESTLSVPFVGGYNVTPLHSEN